VGSGEETNQRWIELINFSKLNLRVRIQSSVPFVYKELNLSPRETVNNLKVRLTLELSCKKQDS
jgi:hypothetical protein